MSKLYRIIITMIVLGMLVSVLPKPTYAHGLQPATELALTVDKLREINRQNMTVNQSRSAEALAAVPHGMYPLAAASGCWYISLTSDQAPPSGSENVTQVFEQAPHGNSYYRSGLGHSQLSAWPQAGAPEEWLLYYRVAVRNKSGLNTRVALVEIQDNGDPLDDVHFHESPADGEWHVFEGPASETGIYVSSDSTAPQLEFDALSIIGCDANFTFLPELKVGEGKQLLDCGEGNTGRWRVGSETNQDIERSLYLVEGSVWNHPSNWQHACWSKIQTKAKNWDTGVVLDFREDRSKFDRKLLIPVAMVGTATLPSWASGVAAVTEGVSAFVSGTGLLVATGWAALLGIGVGGVGYVGWKAHLAEMELRGESTLHPPFEYEHNGRKMRTTYLRDPVDLWETNVHLYRIMDGLNSSGHGYQSWVEEEKILGYLTFQKKPAGRPEGFFYSTQQHSHFSVTERPYSGAVMERAGEIFGQDVIDDDDDWVDIGPVKDADAKSTVDAIEKMLNRKPIPYDPTSKCLLPITNERVGQDIWHYLNANSVELLTEIQSRLDVGENQAETRYQHSKDHRYVGSGAATHFHGHIFIDGLPHVVAYKCIPFGGDATWMLEGLFDVHIVYPHRWHE